MPLYTVSNRTSISTEEIYNLDKYTFNKNVYLCKQLDISNINQQCKIQADKLKGLTRSLFPDCINITTYNNILIKIYWPA
jgi:hypothetical protein